MPSSVNPFKLRAVMGRDVWLPPKPFGDGWTMVDIRQRQSVIVTVADQDGDDWIHASMTGEGDVPSYVDLCRLFRATMPGYAYQVFAPRSDHINIHQYALHLWGRLDGARVLPDFARYGSI